MPIANFNSCHEVEKRRHGECCELLEHGFQKASIPKVFDKMSMPLFPEGCLKNANNTLVSQSSLKGKSVGLYFGDSDDPKCLSFLPFLLQFYRTINEGGSAQKIEVIFVSLDKDMNTFTKHRSHMPWLAISLDDPLTYILKQHFQIQKDYEFPLYGTGPKSTVPAVIIVREDGAAIQTLPIASGRVESERALERWDWRNSRFS